MIELSVNPLLPPGLLIRELKPNDVLDDGGTATLSSNFSDGANAAEEEMSIFLLGCT